MVRGVALPSGTTEPKLELELMQTQMAQKPVLRQLGPSGKAIGKNVIVGHVAGRAGTMRAITLSMPQHVCPREGRPRPTPRYFAAGEVIDFALVAVYGQKKYLCWNAVHAKIICRNA